MTLTLDALGARILDGGRLSAAEALWLYREAPTLWLGRMADAVRQRKHPDGVVTYKEAATVQPFANTLATKGWSPHEWLRFLRMLPKDIAPEALATIHPGENTIVIGARNTSGGQGLDCGLVLVASLLLLGSVFTDEFSSLDVLLSIVPSTSSI